MKYSQFDEEQAILDVCLKNDTGTFLDVGAWHPTDKSNTRALFEAGWSGVMIEPAPEPFLSLLKEYGHEPRVQIICAALGWERGLAKLHVTADMLSTLSDEHRAKWEQVAAYYGQFWTPVVTWDDIFNQFGGFEFVNIDAEGTSVELFFKLLETAARPTCICLEHDGRLVEAAARATAQGYRITYSNGTNVVMAR